jgi:hypothetical protein
MNTYQPGNIILLSAQFTDDSTPPVSLDPTTVKLRIIDPNSVETDYSYSDGTVSKDATGNFSFQLEVVTSGSWFYRWEGTGSVFAANESGFIVSPSAFSNPN